MKIEVQFFSRLRDVVGESRLERNAPDGQTVGGLLESLYAAYPGLREWDAHILTAVGLEYAGRNQPLREGDSVSIMPPVQGG
jgi:MoaD family protein